MKRIFTFLVLAGLFPFLSQAQQQGGRPGGGGGAPMGHITGKVIDGTTQKGAGFATIAILKPSDSSSVMGALTKENGDFNIEEIPFGDYLLQVKFLGFESQYKPFTVSPKTLTQDLGNFKLEATTSTLQGVDVTAQKSAYSMGIDRKVFDVSKSLTSVGGDATDALKNVPSVNVDIDGNVTLRNGSPTIYVDGKSTTLTLEEIPSETIERIEVITNPSSKYSAEGMSGIINIILKKNRLPGLNGQIRAGADTRGGYNGGGNLNIYKNPFNLTLSYFNNHRNNPTRNTKHRDNTFDDSFLDQVSNGKRKGNFQMGSIGLDYFLDNRNTFSISGRTGRGKFNSSQDINSDYLNSENLLDSSGMRHSVNDRSFRFNSGEFTYKHTFEKEGHEITGDFHYSKSKMDGIGTTVNQYQDNTGKPLLFTENQVNNNGGKSTNYSAQIDYENPLTSTGKLEAGLKTEGRNSNSVYDVYDLFDTDSVFNTLLSSDYDFEEKIHAGYLQYSDELGKLGYQLGLRAEDYTYSGSIPSEDLKFNPSKDDWGLFPSAFLTYKVGDNDQLQLNYSRRVRRPNFWQRIPYIDYSDPQNLRKGNPDLKPEYTNSFELAYNKFFGQSNFLATVYFRNTNNAINRFSEPFNNSPDTLISYSINANTSNAYGAEFTLQTQLAKWWSVTGNFNLFQTDLSTTLNGEEVTNNRLSWFAKINTEASLPADFSVQLSGSWNGPVPTSQGTMYRYGSFDMGLQKKIFKKKNGTIMLTFSDLFNTNKNKSIYDSPGFFHQVSEWRRVTRAVRLTFTYRFGKQDISLFKRKSNKSASGGGDMQQMGDDAP